jgi:hypothetical protein
MNTKNLFLAVLMIAGLYAAHAYAQSGTGSAQGPWVMVGAASGDGAGMAFKMNVVTGESYFCFRQNCFLNLYPKQ